MDIYLDNPNNLFITKDSIKSAVTEIITTKNIRKSSVHPKALEFELNKIELVRKSDVFVDVNGTMVIDIEQRKPIARFIDNKSYLRRRRTCNAKVQILLCKSASD